MVSTYISKMYYVCQTLYQPTSRKRAIRNDLEEFPANIYSITDFFKHTIERSLRISERPTGESCKELRVKFPMLPWSRMIEVRMDVSIVGSQMCS